MDTLGTPMNSTFISTFTTGLPTGTVSGTVTYADTGAPIDGATVSILTTAHTTTTLIDGTFVINGVPAGLYTVEVLKSGFVTNSVPVTVVAGSTSAVSISLALANAAPGQIRVILNWNALPHDLDAHILVPTTPTQTEVYYANPGSLTVAPFAQLDRDDTDWFGPETITIAAPALTPPPRYSGAYCYFVHNYSGSSNTDLDTPMRKSGASVQVLNGNTQIAHFNIVDDPGHGSQPYWAVFTVDGATGVLTPLNASQGVIKATPGC
jgi:uncharacterized protein YfaP (DUF2135 family)